MLRLASLLSSLLLAAATLPAAAADEPAVPVERRPTVGLVLSGGGARGIAHVGVLKVLEELHVPVDAIAGTSMGAVAGGLYASGMSAREIEQLVSTLDWAAAFRDRPARADLDFRRKQDDKEFLVDLPLGLKGGEFRIPRGLVQGQKLNQILRRETLSVAQVRDFDQLPVRFRAIATDLETGEPVVLGDGDLAAAMRASMSAPGLFAPVDIGGRLLTDGGVANNLPVDAARAMGVDVLIVVDVSYPPQPRSELNSALSVSNQAIVLMMRRESARQLALLGAGDIILTPELGTLGSVDFTRVADTLQLGERAARGQLERLRALAVDDATWNSYVAARATRTRPLPDVKFVRVDEASRRYEKRIEATMAPLVGAPLDSARLERGMSTLYGDDIFETLDYRLVREGDASGLEFSARRKSWGPNYVRFGLQLQDDFEGGSSFNAGVRFLVTELNGYGAEWRTDLQIGASPRFASELYQPLGYASRLFVSPHIWFEQHNLTLYEDGSPLAEYRVRNDELGIDLGQEIGLWGELRAGLLRGSGSQHLRVGDPAEMRIPQQESFDRGEALLRFSMDRMDNVFFPRHGEQFVLEWRGGRESLGGDQHYDRYRTDWQFARSHGRHTLMLWASAETTKGGGQQPIASYSSLGGLFNLSGLPQQSIAGPHLGIARAIVFRRIGKGGEGFLNVPTYAGISAEYGNVWATRDEISWNNARFDGSLFLGLDTLLGPLYFAAGFDEHGDSAFYLLLGRPL